MPLNKSYVKSRKVFKVTFEVPKEENPENKEIRLLGEFNSWNWGDAPILKKSNGCFKTQLELIPGQKYQYRYLMGGDQWFNDIQADSYIPSPYAYVDNCVVDLVDVEINKVKNVNFTKIEGIGPKISALLVDAGFQTFEQLSLAKKKDLKAILTVAGKRYTMHDPTSWPKQAALLAKGKVKELKVYQDKLKGGRE